jgi:hypothetical protein
MSYNKESIISNRLYSGSEEFCRVPGLKDSAITFFRHGDCKVLKEKFINCTFEGSKKKRAADFCFDYFKTFEGCKFIGGSSEIIKVCRGGQLSFRNCTFISNSRRFPVILSSGVRDVVFDGCKFINESLYKKTAFVFLLGKWSIYDTKYRLFSRNIEINNCEIIGFNNLLMCLFAGLIKIKNTKGRTIYLPPTLVKVCWRLINFAIDKKRTKRPMGADKLFKEEL